jgi:hypothetical protein
VPIDKELVTKIIGKIKPGATNSWVARVARGSARLAGRLGALGHSSPVSRINIVNTVVDIVDGVEFELDPPPKKVKKGQSGVKPAESGEGGTTAPPYARSLLRDQLLAIVNANVGRSASS